LRLTAGKIYIPAEGPRNSPVLSENKRKAQFELSTAAEFRGTEVSLKRNIYLSGSQTQIFANSHGFKGGQVNAKHNRWYP